MNIILCTNNNYQDPFLHSQLLNMYKEFDFIDSITLFCKNGKNDSDINIKNISYGKLSFIIYFLKLLNTLLFVNKNDTTFHIRGFVSGFIFYVVSKIVFWKKIKYIYDPRGAFIIELKEKRALKKSNLLLKILKKVDKNLIKKSIKTIVTTEKFKELYVEEYGLDSQYEVLYNASSFTKEYTIPDIKNKKVLNVCYVGSINYWHDLDEIIRIFSYVKNISPVNIKIFVFTNFKDIALIKEKLESQGLYQYEIKFVPYQELEESLKPMDICISVVKPTISTKIASPIKVSDYIQLNKIIIANEEIGDFDDFFIENNSVQLYRYKKELNFSFEQLINLNVEENNLLKSKLSLKINSDNIRNILEEIY